MRWLVHSSLQFRTLILFLSFLVIFLGITVAPKTRLGVLPEFSPPYVEIQTEALGLSAREVEDLITINQEELLTGTPWVQSLYSKSVPGLSSVFLFFEPGTDIMKARQVVQERLTFSYALPNVSKAPVMLNPLSATSRAMIIGLSSKELSLIDLSVLVRFTIKPKLMGVPGVANVAVWGQRMRQLQVLADPERLLTRGVTLDQVVKTAGNAMWVSPLTYLESSVPGSGGWIDTPSQRLAIQHTQPISMPEDLAKITVDGTSLALGDVAEVIEGHPPLIGDAIVNNEPALLLVVEKMPDVDAREVIRGLDTALDSLRLGLSGVEIDSSIYRSTDFLEVAIDNVGKAVTVGLVLLVLALFALFYEWRAAVISAISVLLSISAAALVLYVSGRTINIMVLAGFAAALAIVVDDAVVDVERILRRLREQKTTPSAGRLGAIIVQAVAETRTPLLYATLIIVLLTAPVFFLTGAAKLFFEPLVASYLLALFASLLVAVTATPALASVLWRALPADREPPVAALRRRYEAILSRALAAPRNILVAGGAIALVAVLVWPLFGQSLLPSLQLTPKLQERDVQITWRSLTNLSYTEMLRTMSQVSRELQSVPGVVNVAAHLGRAVTGDQIVDVDSGQIWISIDPKADYGTALAAIESTVDDYPGFAHEVRGYLRATVRQVFTGTGDAILVRLRGPDWEGLQHEATRVKQALADVDGLVNLRVSDQTLEPQIEVRVDLQAAAKFGLKPGDVRRAAATIFSGLEVGSLFEHQKVFDVVVWSPADKRKSISDVQDLLIDTSDGGHVRLGDVANVRVVPVPNLIEREGISRIIDIVAGVRGRDLIATAADVESKLQGLEFPSEYYPELRAESVELQGTQWPMLVAVLAALIGIYFLLQASFRSWSLALAALLLLPLALAGPLVAMHAAGNTIVLGALIGAIAVLSVAVRQIILFVHNCQDIELRGEGVFGLPLVLRAAREQFAPVLMSATTTALALSGFIYFGPTTGLEIVHPMAIIILSGLLTSAALTLFVAPAAYLLFGTTPEPELNFADGDFGSVSDVTH